MAATVAPAAESARFGPYDVRELLGRGGMGEVHRAYDTVHQRDIALKRLPAAIVDEEYRARFRRESRIVADLRHPNVVPVHAFGEIDGELYLDMMLIDGVDLGQSLAAGRLDPHRCVEILSQVADALDKAHAGGLVHRDVKPSNILVDRRGQAFLADFGIARSVSVDATAVTRTGVLMGSLDYMAPERFSRGVVDGRSDVYSLTCVLFECLTGRRPFPAPEPAAKIAAQLLDPPPVASLLDPQIPPALDAVLARGMAKDPGERWATATMLMAAAGSAVRDRIGVADAAPTVTGPRPDREQDRLVLAVLATAAGRPDQPGAADPTGCPYPGLGSFQVVDAAWFYGREHAVTALLARLCTQLGDGEPVVLVGASGAGKSSLLAAGLLPALAAGEDNRPQLLLTPGHDPVDALATATATTTGLDAATVALTIRADPTRFGQLWRTAGDPARPLIVVDQFEELFTHGVPGADQLAFATAPGPRPARAGADRGARRLRRAVHRAGPADPGPGHPGGARPDGRHPAPPGHHAAGPGRRPDRRGRPARTADRRPRRAGGQLV
jgi:tRNA A-37 threonylcarbamoyl transferase component Bud32